MLGVVVAGAGRGEVVFAGGAFGPGDGVVEVAVLGVGFAAGGGAGGGPGADEVGELPRGPVRVFAQPMVAGVAGDGGEGDVQVAEEGGEVAGMAGRGWRPGAGAAGAAVGDRAAGGGVGGGEA